MAAVEAVSNVMAQLDQLGVKRQRMTVDSRSITVGDVFVAVPGAQLDGRSFVQQALGLGAAAVLRDAVGLSVPHADARVIDVVGLSSISGHIADAFYESPSSNLRVFGITGTNGKTSIANWLSHALSQLGVPCGAVGTLGVSLGAKTWPTQNTTPDATQVHTILRELRDCGAEAVAMEVSSHALALHRGSRRLDRRRRRARHDSPSLHRRCRSRPALARAREQGRACRKIT